MVFTIILKDLTYLHYAPNLFVLRYICNIDGWWHGRCDHLGLRYPHGRCESSAADVRGRRPSVHRLHPLHESERQRGGSEGLFQRPPTERSEGLPRQRRHLPQLRETDEALLSIGNMTSLLTMTLLFLQVFPWFGHFTLSTQTDCGSDNLRVF